MIVAGLNIKVGVAHLLHRAIYDHYGRFASMPNHIALHPTAYRMLMREQGPTIDPNQFEGVPIKVSIAVVDGAWIENVNGRMEPV